MPKPLSLIGLDPGATTAYAVLDLNGQLLQAFSAKELPLSQVISRIIEVSLPLVTATDKEKAPSLVQEFAAQLGTLLIAPSQDLKREEKEDLVNDSVKVKTKNEHEHDALAAALFAYKKLASTLAKIDCFIKKNELEGLRNPFTRLVLKENLDLESAKRILTSPQQENQIVRQVLVENRITKTDFLELFEKLNRTKKEKALLENKLCQLDQTLSHLRQTNLFLAKKLGRNHQQIDALFNFKEKRIKDFSQEIGKKEKEKELLLKEIKELKSLLFDRENKMIIPKVKDLGQNFRKKEFPFKEGSYLFVENPHILSPEVWLELKEKGIKLFSQVKKKGVFVLDNFSDKEDFIITDKNTLEKALNQRDILDEIIEEHQNFRKTNK